jgi:chromosome partitioning protein
MARGPSVIAMPPRVAVINMKGGVAKTTLAVNIAHCAAIYHGKKTLLVDADPQFNASQYLMQEADYRQHLASKCTIYDIFFDGSDAPVSVATPRPRRTRLRPTRDSAIVRVASRGSGHLDLVPSNLKLMELETIARQKEKRLSKFLDQVQGAYDLVVIDCPPTISVFTLSAYLASNAYLVPLKPDPLSVVGLPLLESAVHQYAEDSGHTSRQLGLVFTMVRKTELMEETMADIQERRGDDVFEARLSFGTQVAKAAIQHHALTEHPQGRKFGLEIGRITSEFLGRVASIP